MLIVMLVQMISNSQIHPYYQLIRVKALPKSARLIPRAEVLWLMEGVLVMMLTAEELAVEILVWEVKEVRINVILEVRYYPAMAFRVKAVFIQTAVTKFF